MAKNELVIGEPRLGWFVDGNPETDHVAAMLRDTGAAIELTIPLRGIFDDDDPYRRWWSSGVMFGDDPDRTKYSYRPPRVVLVEDAIGPVVLVGCRSASSRSNLSVGHGLIVANFAVLDGNSLKYEKLHGLRTEVPALAAWTRLSNMDVTVEKSEDNRAKSVEMKLTDASPLQLARPLNLVMRSNWRTEKSAGSFRAYEGIKLETLVRAARSWNDHLRVHGAILELASIAAWKPFGFSTIEVQHADDSHRDMSGEVTGGRWLKVVTHRLPKHEPWTKEPSFLFPYSEIGPPGAKQWLRLRKEYGRVIGPLMGILRSDDKWGPSNIVQSGIALEALGYLIDVKKNAGANLNSRQQMSFKAGLRVILNDLEENLLQDPEGWIERSHAAYMGLKHLDRTEPDSLVMINALRENLLVIRSWIGLQLGVKPDSLRNRLRDDPLAYEIVLAD